MTLHSNIAVYPFQLHKWKMVLHDKLAICCFQLRDWKTHERIPLNNKFAVYCFRSRIWKLRWRMTSHDQLAVSHVQMLYVILTFAYVYPVLFLRHIFFHSKNQLSNWKAQNPHVVNGSIRVEILQKDISDELKHFMFLKPEIAQTLSYPHPLIIRILCQRTQHADKLDFAFLGKIMQPEGGWITQWGS